MKHFIILIGLSLFIVNQSQGQFNLEIDGKLSIGATGEADTDSLFLVSDSQGNMFTRQKSTLDLEGVPQPLDIHTGYSNWGSPYPEGSIYKKESRVYLSGLLSPDSGIVEDGDTLAILPLQYRPNNRILSNGYQTTSSPRVDVLTTGEVIVVSGADASSDFISLEAINYRIEDYNIGDRVGGGILFYIANPPEDLNGDGQVDRGLVAAPEDLDDRLPWGCFGTSISQAANVAIGSGQQNTTAIIEECADGNSAARGVDDYSVNNYHDWFLPSIDELFEMSNNIGYDAEGDLFNIGEFQENIHYWSSTQQNSAGSWTVAFSSNLSLIHI